MVHISTLHPREVQRALAPENNLHCLLQSRCRNIDSNLKKFKQA